MISDKPWFLVFYKFKCPLCKMLKPTIATLAERVHDEFNIGMVNCYKSEMLKETFGVDKYPMKFFIKDGMVYEYKESG